MSEKQISLIEKRVIEAQAIVPLITAFGQELGLEKAKTIVQKINEAASFTYGRDYAAQIKSNTLDDLITEISSWGEGGALEEEILEHTDTTYAFNVTHCEFAKQYEKLGIQQFGYCLSCCRDKPFVDGFNPNITFHRTQTIMEGAPYCDFKYTVKG